MWGQLERSFGRSFLLVKIGGICGRSNGWCAKTRMVAIFQRKSRAILFEAHCCVLIHYDFAIRNDNCW